MQTTIHPLENNLAANVPAIYGRYKGADWFNLLYRKDIMILGQGGIGSWLSFLLSRTGAHLYLYDMDSFEDHNGGQLMFGDNVGQLKTEALRKTISRFSPDCNVEIFGEYTSGSETNRIVLTGFDRNSARKVAFENWAKYVAVSPAEDRQHFFFQDGRLLLEQFMIFSIPGNRPDLIEKYRNDYLYSDDEVLEPQCTTKQTPHMAAKIAAQMEIFLTNWVSNVGSGIPCKKVPFFHEYFAALNLAVNTD